MSALVPDEIRTMREAVKRGDHGHYCPPLSLEIAGKWAGLHAHACDLAELAQLSPEPFDGAIATFPDRISAACERDRELAWQGLEDIEAMMKPGLAALENLRQREAPATAPALTLWREFYNARGAVMSLARG